MDAGASEVTSTKLTAPVSSLVELSNGFPFDSDLFQATGKIPLVRIRDLTAASFETFLDVPVPNDFMVSDGDLIVGMDGDFLAVMWHRGSAALNQRLCRLRPRFGADIRFVAYALPESLRVIQHTQFATTVKHLSSREILQARIPKKSLADQRRIADFLDDQIARIDNIVAAREKQTELEDAALTARLRELLLAGSTVPARRLLREAVVGIVVQPSKYYVEAAEPGVPALRGLNVSENKISTENLVRISQEGHRFHPRSRLGSGDVVVVRTGDAGAACVVPEWADDWNAIDLVVLRTNPAVDPGYLAYALNASRRDQSIAAASSGSIQQHFGVGAVGDLPIVFREPEEQARVVAQAADAYSIAGTRRELLNHSIALLRELKRSLITAAVTGEFDVTAADGSRVPV